MAGEAEHCRLGEAATRTRSSGSSMDLSREDVDALLAVLETPLVASDARPLRKSPAKATRPSSFRGVRKQSKTTKKPSSHRRSATPTRDREVMELRSLRATESELQARLSAIRAAIAAPGRVRGRQAALRYVARRQLALRREAERRNRELREELSAQHRLLRELIAHMAAQFTASLHHPHYLLSDVDQGVLEHLARGIDRIYDMMPAAFPQDEDAKRIESARSVDRFLESIGAELTDGAAVQLPGSELRDDRELPFDFYSVIDATWRSMTAWHAGANSAGTGWITSRSFPGVERPEHTFAVRVRLHSKMPAQLPVYFTEKVVVRRYIEPGRFVVVWLGSYDGEMELLGSRTVELGWIVVEQLPAHSDEAPSEPPTTPAASKDPSIRGRVRIRLYGRVIPTTSNAATRRCEEILASTSTKSCRDDFSFIYQHMGRLLAASSTGPKASNAHS